MIKNIKDMTVAEKQERITHLSHKFYDVNERPSALLLDEIESQGIKPDAFLADVLRNLKTLEVQHYELDTDSTATIVPALLVLNKAFEYESQKLKEEYEKEKRTKLRNLFRKSNRTAIDEKYKKKLNELEQQKNKQLAEIRKSAKSSLELCEKVMNITFMAAIKHIYR